MFLLKVCGSTAPPPAGPRKGDCMPRLEYILSTPAARTSSQRYPPNISTSAWLHLTTGQWLVLPPIDDSCTTTRRSCTPPVQTCLKKLLSRKQHQAERNLILKCFQTKMQWFRDSIQPAPELMLLSISLDHKANVAHLLESQGKCSRGHGTHTHTLEECRGHMAQLTDDSLCRDSKIATLAASQRAKGLCFPKLISQSPYNDDRGRPYMWGCL